MVKIQQAASILWRGGLVAFPTETVYGLGADARDPRAVARIFEVKDRPRFDPLIVHVVDTQAAEELVTEFSAMAGRLADRFWPGPLTIVLPKTDEIPDIVTAGLPTVALRVPDHPVAQALLSAAAVPIAAPSANRFGCLSPTTADAVREQLGDAVDLILDGGPCRVGVESTVVQLTDGEVILLRLGGVTVENLEAVVGAVVIPELDGDSGTTPQISPGRLLKHYAPNTPVILDPDDLSSFAAQRVGLLSFGPPEDPSLFASIEVLSASGDLTEAAAKFFSGLHRLDAQDLDAIVATSFPDTGLGRALNDRLRRAAQR